MKIFKINYTWNWYQYNLSISNQTIFPFTRLIQSLNWKGQKENWGFFSFIPSLGLGQTETFVRLASQVMWRESSNGSGDGLGQQWRAIATVAVLNGSDDCNLAVAVAAWRTNDSVLVKATTATSSLAPFSWPTRSPCSLPLSIPPFFQFWSDSALGVWPCECLYVWELEPWEKWMRERSNL